MSKLIRSIFVLLAATLTFSQVLAQTRSVSVMKEIAEYHLYSDNVTLAMEDGDLLVFNKADNEGFVVLSSNPEMPEVVGFSDSGHFNPDSIPTNMKFWMDCINRTSEAVALGQISSNQAFATAPSTRAEVSPLLGRIMWDQTEPYNLHCPTVNGELTVTGCGATALAQMMMYYKYPTVGKNSISYEWQKTPDEIETIFYDFTQKPFDWDKMRDSYTSSYEKNNDPINTSIGQISFTGLESYSTSDGIMILVDTLFNNSKQDFIGDVTFLLFDKNNNFIEASSYYIPITETLESGYMWGTLSIVPGRVVFPLSFSMPSVYPDDTYRIYLGCRKKGSSEWSKCSSYKGLSANFLEVKKSGTLFSIDGLVADCSYEAAEADAVSELMYACGVALQTEYGVKESSVSIMEPFFGSVEFFGYDKDIFMASEKYLSTQLKNDIIIEELQANRPVYLGGTTKPDQNNMQAGHAFIADGVRYDTNRTPWFHINWGWNGYMNGYFLITSLAPQSTGTGAADGDDYAYELFILGGFQPENEKAEGSTFSYEGLKCNTEKVDKGGSFGISIGSLFCMSYQPISGVIKVFLKEEDKEYDCGVLVDFSGQIVEPFQGWKWKAENYDTFKVPESIPDGVYEIVLRSESKTEKGVFGRYITKESPKLTVGNPTVIEQIKRDEPSKERLFDLFGRPATAKTAGIIVTGSGKKVMVKD